MGWIKTLFFVCFLSVEVLSLPNSSIVKPSLNEIEISIQQKLNKHGFERWNDIFPRGKRHTDTPSDEVVSGVETAPIVEAPVESEVEAEREKRTLQFDPSLLTRCQGPDEIIDGFDIEKYLQAQPDLHKVFSPSNQATITLTEKPAPCGDHQPKVKQPILVIPRPVIVEHYEQPILLIHRSLPVVNDVFDQPSVVETEIQQVVVEKVPAPTPCHLIAKRSPQFHVEKTCNCAHECNCNANGKTCNCAHECNCNANGKTCNCAHECNCNANELLFQSQLSPMVSAIPKKTCNCAHECNCNANGKTCNCAHECNCNANRELAQPQLSPIFSYVPLKRCNCAHECNCGCNSDLGVFQSQLSPAFDMVPRRHCNCGYECTCGRNADRLCQSQLNPVFSSSLYTPLEFHSAPFKREVKEELQPVEATADTFDLTEAFDKDIPNPPIGVSGATDFFHSSGDHSPHANNNVLFSDIHHNPFIYPHLTPAVVQSKASNKFDYFESGATIFDYGKASTTSHPNFIPPTTIQVQSCPTQTFNSLAEYYPYFLKGAPQNNNIPKSKPTPNAENQPKAVAEKSYVPEQKPAAQVFENRPAAQVPEIRPAAQVPESIPAAQVPENRPAVQVPENRLAAQVPENKPASEASESMPTAQVPVKKLTAQVPEEKPASLRLTEPLIAVMQEYSHGSEETFNDHQKRSRMHGKSKTAETAIEKSSPVTDIPVPVAVSQTTGSPIPEAAYQNNRVLVPEVVIEAVSASIPHLVPKLAAQYVPENIPVGVFVPESIPVTPNTPVPSAVPQTVSAPVPVPQTVSALVPENIPKGISAPASVNAPQPANMYVAELAPQTVSAPVPQHIAQVVSEYVPENVPQIIPALASEIISAPVLETAPQIVSNTIPKSAPPHIAQVANAYVPENAPQIISAPVLQAAPQMISNVAPESVLQSAGPHIPGDGMESVAKPMATVQPYVPQITRSAMQFRPDSFPRMPLRMPPALQNIAFGAPQTAPQAVSKPEKKEAVPVGLPLEERPAALEPSKIQSVEPKSASLPEVLLNGKINQVSEVNSNSIVSTGQPADIATPPPVLSAEKAANAKTHDLKPETKGEAKTVTEPAPTHTKSSSKSKSKSGKSHRGTSQSDSSKSKKTEKEGETKKAAEKSSNSSSERKEKLDLEITQKS